MVVNFPSTLDYCVFAFSLLISIGTGIYHAVKSKLVVSHDGTTAKDEYLMGGRQMPVLPVVLSLLTSFLSGVLMLGVPAETYQRGALQWMFLMTAPISLLITSFVFLPVFHKMRCTCLHEYFVLRYDSRLIRRLFSCIFCILTLSYMAVVIYAPSVALSEVLRINKRWLIVIFGVSTTLYTCIGGLKAVVWADSLQAVMMYGGVFSLIIRALMHPRVGGVGRVAELAWDTGRIQELFRLDWRIDQKLIYYTLLPFTILCTMVAGVGLLVLAYYHGCDPMEALGIVNKDHIVIIFARDILHPVSGLFGLYVSCIMAATLSTLSSGMNSMAAAIYEDFFVPSSDGKISDSRATLVNKVAVSVMGVTSGPMVAIFVLAIFFPRSGKMSCLVSFVLSNLIMMVIFWFNYMENPYDQLFLSTNTTISSYAYAGLGFALMLSIGVPLTFFEKPNEKIRHLTWVGRNDPWPESCHEFELLTENAPPKKSSLGGHHLR